MWGVAKLPTTSQDPNSSGEQIVTDTDAVPGGPRKTLEVLLPWGVLGAAYGISLTITPFFYNGLGLEEEMIGKLTGAQGIGVICAAGLARRLSLRIGPSRAFASSVFLYALLVTLFGQLTDPLALALARFGDGVLAVVAVVAVEIALTSNLTERSERARCLGVMTSVGAVGFCVGALSAKLFAGWLSFPILFSVAGAIALLSAAIGAIKIAPEAAEQGTVKITEAPSGTTSQRILSRGKHALFGAFSSGVFHATWIVLMPLAVMQLTGLPEELLLWLAPLHILGVILLTPWLVRILPGPTGIALLAMICAMAVLLASSTALVALTFALVFLIGGASAALQARMLTSLLDIAGNSHDATHANTLNASLGAIGKVVGPILLGMLATHRGPAALLTALAAIWTLCACAALSAHLRSTPSLTPGQSDG